MQLPARPFSLGLGGHRSPGAQGFVVLDGNLSTKLLRYSSTAGARTRLVKERTWQGHGSGKGQAFPLTKASLHTATSSLTFIQTFLPGGDSHPRPQKARSKQKQCLSFVWIHRREHKAWQKRSRKEPQHCQAPPAKLPKTFRITVVEDRCPALGYRPTRHPRTWNSSISALQAPPSHLECSPKPQLIGATKKGHCPR